MKLTHRKQFQSNKNEYLTNHDRMQFYLQLKYLNSLLRICPNHLIARFIYETPAFAPFANALLAIVINTTLHNQLSLQQFKNDLPASQKKYQNYLTVVDLS